MQTLIKSAFHTTYWPRFFLSYSYRYTHQLTLNILDIIENTVSSQTQKQLALCTWVGPMHWKTAGTTYSLWGVMISQNWVFGYVSTGNRTQNQSEKWIEDFSHFSHFLPYLMFLQSSTLTREYEENPSTELPNSKTQISSTRPITTYCLSRDGLWANDVLV